MVGRIRSIKPELLEDEKAAELPDAVWRLFVSTWLVADDHGNFRAGDRYLASHVWQDTTKLTEALSGLRRLAAGGFVQVYEVSGERYGHVVNWSRHQRIDNAGKPRVPGPDKLERDLTEEFAKSCGNSQRFAARPRPTTNDQDQRSFLSDKQSDPVYLVWEHFNNARLKRYPKSRRTKLNATRKSHIKARLKDVGQERIMAAIPKFFDRRYFWARGDEAKRPELLFRSLDQFEKVENASAWGDAPTGRPAPYIQRDQRTIEEVLARTASNRGDTNEQTTRERE